MAQKATKTLATRNSATLKRIHLLAIGVHLTFIFLRLFLMWRSVTSRTITCYVIFSLPALVIEVFLEINSRPKFNAAGDITRAGDDLDAKGLTEYFFDVMYWTWGTIIVAIIMGDRAWWIWGVVPVYSLWAAYRAFGGVKESLAGLSGAGGEGSGAGTQSNRQKKMEKRGGQRMQYR